MKAAHAGVAAFDDGIAESSCPYKVATLAYSAWRKGWQEARDRAGPSSKQLGIDPRPY
jgi:hypothetical protein